MTRDALRPVRRALLSVIAMGLAALSVIQGSLLLALAALLTLPVFLADVRSGLLPGLSGLQFAGIICLVALVVVGVVFAVAGV